MLKQHNSGIKTTQYKELTKQQNKINYSFKGQAKQHYSFDSQKAPPTFSSPQFSLSKPLIKACRELDYDHPTPIQAKAIPLISKSPASHDLLATASTGSGKTACFLLPILQKLIRSYQSKKSSQHLIAKTRALILIPTRELAAQCNAMLQQLKKYVNFITSCLVIGGADTKRQQMELRSRPDIVIATTGRLLDHAVNSKSIDLSGIKYLVLDEADKLLQMDFKDQLKQVLKMCGSGKNDSKGRQTLLFSATLNDRVELLADFALKNPVRINTYGNKKNKQMTGVPMLQQYIVRLRLKDVEDQEVKVEDKSKKKQQLQQLEDEKKEQIDQDSDNDNDDDNDDEDEGDANESDDNDDEQDQNQQQSDDENLSYNKQDEDQIKKTSKPQKKKDPAAQLAQLYRKATLIALCKRNFKKRVIIFFNTRTECHTMLGLFTFLDLNAVQLHGQLDQKQRLQAVTQFQKGRADYLLATDLVSRGIDIQNVNAVINYQFPKQITRYTHRIGRTARAGNYGVALTICDQDERRLLKKMSRKSTNGQISTYSVPLKLVQNCKENILSIQSKLQELIQNQNDEGQLKKAESELLRAENMLAHKDQILSKPKKQWHKSVKDKRQLQKASKELLDQNFKKFLESQNRSADNNQKKKKGVQGKMLKREMKRKLKSKKENDKAARQMKLVKKHHKKKLRNKDYQPNKSKQSQQNNIKKLKKKSVFDKQKS